MADDNIPNRLHPLMHSIVEGGVYQPSALRSPVRNDSAYVGPEFQRYQSPELKASGFYGELGNPREAVTEYSLGGMPASSAFKRAPVGQGFTYPSIAPGMTKQQINDVVNFATGGTEAPAPFSPMPGIAQNARESAQERMSQGKSPFWNPQQDYLFRGLR